MLTRTVLAALASAAVLAGGSTTVLVTASGNEHGLEQRSPRATEAQQDHAKGTEGADGAEDVQAAEVELPPCPADVKNHGAYVSSVAKANHGHAEDEGTESDETNHGAMVSAAAQSDCGKPEGGDGEETAEETKDDAAAKAERDVAKAARKAARSTPGKSGEEHGNANPGEARTTP